jgi:DHA1 family bicyclomycin/chloramphenicol resistance-like MFS transporter
MSGGARTPPAGADYLRTVAILGGLTAMGPLAIDMYLPALPAMARDLHATPALVQVSLATYFIGIAGGQAIYGPLSDWMGRKPALYLGLLVFTLSSVACALAPRVGLLIACRFLQALGGCAPLVVPRAVVRDHFDEQASVRALSALVLVMGLAPILAPFIGGQLLTHWGWRAIFWVLAGYGAVWLVIVTAVPAREACRRRASAAVARRRAGHVRPASGGWCVPGLGVARAD